MTIRSILMSQVKRLRDRAFKKVKYENLLPFNSEAEFHIAVVGSKRCGLANQGKMTTGKYLPKFEHSATIAGATVVFYQNPNLFMQSLHIHGTRPLAVIFVYSEESKDIQNFPDANFARVLANRPKTIIYNSPEIARKIADKQVTNQILSDAGIDVPQNMTSTDVEVFSNTTTGSHMPTLVLKPGSAIDPTRYNTELIDTRVTVKGLEYFVSLRAMCVGNKLMNVFVRCRPVTDGTPNVHSRDTPLDPGLLNSIYHEQVKPRMHEIKNICERLGAELGPAFYAHDILISRDGRLPVCEVGLKFDDATLLTHLWPVSSELEFMHGAFLYQQAEKAAELIVESLRNEH